MARVFIGAILLHSGCAGTSSASTQATKTGYIVHKQTQSTRRVVAAPNLAESKALRERLLSLMPHPQGRVAVVVKDLSDNTLTAINPFENMAAASVIKVPVMVEVFAQIKHGNIDLNTAMILQKSDVDHGWGQIDNDPPGKKLYPVWKLLHLMIDYSDNTATNMLIRLVGRQNINHRMRSLNFSDTYLADYLRTDDDLKIRSLRTSPRDMANMFIEMAHGRLIDRYSSAKMLDILRAQTENTYMPFYLPVGLQIAHKTGTLDDTVHDVGLVYLGQHPYIVVLMTANDQNLDYSKGLIRRLSRAVYDFERGLPESRPIRSSR